MDNPAIAFLERTRREAAEREIGSVILYARTAGINAGPHRQIEDLRRFAAHRGWAIAGEFTDTGREQPERAKAVALIDAGAADALVVTTVSRLGTRIADFPRVRLIFAFQAVDTEEPAGRLVRSILDDLAELEAENTEARRRRRPR